MPFGRGLLHRRGILPRRIDDGVKNSPVVVGLGPENVQGSMVFVTG